MKLKNIVGEFKSGKTNPCPNIECWRPECNHKEIGMIIFPGGAYCNLAEHEGRGYAEHFAKVGIACFVVNYRLSHQGFQHPAMLEDALAAIHTIRLSAADLGVKPHKLGIMGSSAGGHLAAHALVAWKQYEGDVSLRPDFGVLCYPVITARGPHTHNGSICNLAGDAVSDSVLDELSCERHVSDDTPPCFIWHTGEDSSVPAENSILFASALRKHRIPFELHVYEKGTHGIGLNAPFSWETDCLRWIENTTQQRCYNGC